MHDAQKIGTRTKAAVVGYGVDVKFGCRRELLYEGPPLSTASEAVAGSPMSCALARKFLRSLFDVSAGSAPDKS